MFKCTTLLKFLVIIVNLIMFVTCDGRKAVDEDIIIAETINSPNKEHIATVYYVSGGGAAGYVYAHVGIRNKGESFTVNNGTVLQGVRIENLSVKWEDSKKLIIFYSKAGTIFTKKTEWADKSKVLIEYIEP